MRVIAVTIALAIPTLASAQGIIVPRCPRPRPDMPIVEECLPMRAQVVRTRSDVKVELRDRVLRYEVEERFVNRGGVIGEADYVFPLPKGAAFRDLKLSIDGQMVAGETMSATEARRIYEDIVRRQKDPALVEWMGHGLLRTRIFPINAGEERRIAVRFESVAEREGDAVRVDYFRGSRHADVGREITPLMNQRRNPNDEGRVNFALTYRAGGELGEAYSPTHELDVDRDDAMRSVSIRGGGPDITVLVALRRSLAASVAVLTHAQRNEPGYALITVTPPTDLARNRMPRDLTFVMDVSGSMSGQKLDQAKAAGRQLLRTLTPQDRFRVIDFSTDVRSFRDDFVFATDANVRSAIRYIDDLEATGSTNISGALQQALGESGDGSGSRQSERLPLVLFMTDGAATVGERDPARIAARAARDRGDARIFTFGLGADLNISLMEQLAIEGRGTAHFVRPEENVERVVGLVASRLRTPLLTDVRIGIEGSDVRLSRLYPAGALDVFSGQDLVVLARYSGSGRANVVVQGRANGRDVRWSSARNFARDERENGFVPRLWATQRIGWLAAEKRRNGGSPEIDDEIRQLGERFGIPTEFTSYLVVEPGMVAGNMNRDQQRRRDNSGRADLGVTPPASAAPREFEAARNASEQRAAKSLGAAQLSEVVVTSSDGRGESTLLKRAGTRLFRQDGERLVDSRMKDGLQVYKVKAYSPSYFSLLERIPELREAFTVGDRVIVAGRAVAIEVVADAPELSESELQAITRGW